MLVKHLSELHLGALLKALAVGDSGKVAEDVASAFVGLDESISLITQGRVLRWLGTLNNWNDAIQKKSHLIVVPADNSS